MFALERQIVKKGESEMCGRYYVDDETAREIEKVAREVDAKLRKEKMGDIYPSQAATVLTGKLSGLKAEKMNWVFDDKFLEFALHKVPVQLNKQQEFEQQRLF